MACNNLISNAAIESVYNDGAFVASNRVVSSCINNDTKKAFVEIFDENNTALLEKPIERSYFRQKPLLSNASSSGKVVKHEYFILKDEFQGKKIASKVHAKEMEVYRNNGFVEIQLDAAWDGLVVWKKMLYKFASAKDENLIKIAIQRYLREVKRMSISEIEKAIKNNPFSIHVSYLKDDSQDFKEWIYGSFNKIGLAKMYKELAA